MQAAQMQAAQMQAAQMQAAACEPRGAQARVTFAARRRTAPSGLAVLAVEVRPVDVVRVPIARRRVISQRDTERLLETLSSLLSEFYREVRNDVDVQLGVLELRRWVNRGLVEPDERRGALLVFCQLAQPNVHPVAVDLRSGRAGVMVGVGLGVRL